MRVAAREGVDRSRSMSAQHAGPKALRLWGPSQMTVSGALRVTRPGAPDDRRWRVLLRDVLRGARGVKRFDQSADVIRNQHTIGDGVAAPTETVDARLESTFHPEGAAAVLRYLLPWAAKRHLGAT